MPANFPSYLISLLLSCYYVDSLKYQDLFPPPPPPPRFSCRRGVVVTVEGDSFQVRVVLPFLAHAWHYDRQHKAVAVAVAVTA